MMALKSCARFRRPGPFQTQSRGTRFDRLRKTLSRRPMGPFCTGEPIPPRPPPPGPLLSAFQVTYVLSPSGGEKQSSNGVGRRVWCSGLWDLIQGRPAILAPGQSVKDADTEAEGRDALPLTSYHGAWSGMAACPSPRTLRSTSSTVWNRWAT